jgi:phosphohistidine phosphatase
MKTLILVRHAKSSWDDATLADKDRPLNDRGKRDAPKMAKRLAKRDVKVHLILSSPAKRAIKTARVFSDELDYKRKDIVIDERLYPGTVNDLFELIHKLHKKMKRVALVGHDPALSKLAQALSSDITHMPTCAVAEFRFDAESWPDVGKATLATVAFDFPKKA